MADETLPREQVDLREKLAHIDLMLAQHDRVRQEIDYGSLQACRLQREIGLAPWALVISSMTAGVALFAAAFALAKLFA